MTTNEPSAAASGIENAIKARVNLSSLAFAALVCLIGVKLLMLLPGSYYFGFAKSVDDSSASQFIVEAPGVSEQRYCEIMKDLKLFEMKELRENGQVSACRQRLNIPDPFAAQDMQSNEQSPGDAEVANSDEDQDTSTVIDDDLSDSQKKQIDKVIQKEGSYHFLIALTLKLLPPFFTGIITFTLWRRDAFVTAPVGAALTAFLLCWPVIAFWKIIVTDEFADRQNLFFMLYAAYIAMYYAIAKMGVVFCELAMRHKLIETGDYTVSIGKIFSTTISSAILVVINVIGTQTIAALR